MDDDEVMRCLECGNSDLIWDYGTGELISERCGSVVSSDLLEHVPERRAFDIARARPLLNCMFASSLFTTQT